MNKYFSDHFHKTFQSIRKETREKLHLSFHRAYILCFALIVLLGALYVWLLNSSANSGYQMTGIESTRREKQQEKHFLRAQVARQESPQALEAADDNTIPIPPAEVLYIHLP
jgi:hypothetical protein